MKLLAYGLIILTLLLTIQAVEQQLSGHAEVSHPGRSVFKSVVDRKTNPDEYENLMTYQWIRAFLPGLAGVFLLHLVRRSNRLDPFSPHFQGKEEIDKLSEYLDEKKE